MLCFPDDRSSEAAAQNSKRRDLFPCKNLLKPSIFFSVVTAEVYLKHYYSTINVFLQSVLKYNKIIIPVSQVKASIKAVILLCFCI